MDYNDLLVQPNYFQDFLELDEDELEEENFMQHDLNIIKEEAEEESSSKHSLTQSQHIKAEHEYQSAVSYLIPDTFQVPVLLVDEEQDRRAKKLEVAKLKTFKQQMDQKEEEKRHFEKRFARILREQAEKILNQDRQAKILKKLEKTIKPEKVQPAVQEMLVEEKAVSKPKRASQVMVDKKCVEGYQQTIEQLKQQHNEDQELIKTLKIQIGRLKDLDSTHNSSVISKGTVKSKKELLQEENERLHEEVVQLKKQIHEERQSYKTQLSRQHKVQSALNKQKEAAKPKPAPQYDYDQLNSELQKARNEINQQACEFRKRMKEQLDAQNALKDKLSQKEQEISTLLQKLEKRKDQEQQLLNLQEQLKQKDTEIDETKEAYLIDNQLKLIFPKYGQLVLSILNFVMKFEEEPPNTQPVDRINSLLTFFFKRWVAFLRKIRNGLKYIYQLGKYLCFRKPIHHPSNQELLKIAISKIRTHPTALEKIIINQNTQIESLLKQLQECQRENGELRDINKLNQEKYEKIDELLKIDKFELAKNLQMFILKAEAEDRANIPEFKTVKTYYETVFKYMKTQNSVSPNKQNLNQKQKKIDQVPLREPICSKKERHKKRDQ